MVKCWKCRTFWPIEGRAMRSSAARSCISNVVGEFTSAEKADMNLKYGAANCDGRVAPRLYGEGFPCRIMPDHKMLPRLYQQLYEKRSFMSPDRKCQFSDL